MKAKGSIRNHIGAIIALLCAGIVVLIDQVSKALIVDNLVTEGNSVTVINGLLNFTLSYNDGMAFGLGSSVFRWVFVGIMVVVGGILIYFMFNPKYNSPLFLSAAALVIGGGIGNAIDRVLNGYVVDFLALSFFPPICNIADYAITIGTVLLLIYVLFVYGKNDKKQVVNEPVEFLADKDE
ncbi:MAG: signal peptidase II [Clostridia bacterium]|nr:signal peptidase II [Clostridia bacterium]